MPFRKVATVQEVTPGRGTQVTVAGRTIGLYTVGGTIYAIDDACPHRGASLCEGDVISGEVLCPWHGARFDVKTGQHLSPPASRGVTAYPVQVVGDEIQVDLP